MARVGCYEREIAVAAPTGRVWSVLQDLGSWPGWTPSMTRGGARGRRPAARRGAGAGAPAPLPPAVWTVTAVEPGRSFSWSTATPGLRSTADHEIHPGPAGARWCSARADRAARRAGPAADGADRAPVRRPGGRGAAGGGRSPGSAPAPRPRPTGTSGRRSGRRAPRGPRVGIRCSEVCVRRPAGPRGGRGSPRAPGSGCRSRRRCAAGAYGGARPDRPSRRRIAPPGH
jgi:hypothetical protein